MKKTLNRIRATLAIVATASSSVAFAAAGDPVGPFGLGVGQSSCAEAMRRLGAPELSGDGPVKEAVAADPGALYPGATKVFMLCMEDKLEAVFLTIGKGGMGNEAAAEVYGFLAGKYKRTAGGPMPRVGSGFARFSPAGAVVQLAAPHMSFTFDVAYMSTKLHNLAEVGRKAQEQAAKDAKRSAL